MRSVVWLLATKIEAILPRVEWSVASTLMAVLVGFTQTELKNQSVGSLMLQEMVRDCIARGDTLLDFTIGDERYKLTFGASKQPMWQISRSGSPLGFVAGTAVERVPALKALARSFLQRRRSELVSTLTRAPVGQQRRKPYA